MTNSNWKLFELDGRRRISLGALATSNYYLVEVSADGVITLTPAEVAPRKVPGGPRYPRPSRPAPVSEQA